MKKKLTPATIKKIRKEFNEGYTIASLAEYYGRSNISMHNIAYFITYKSVPGKQKYLPDTKASKARLFTDKEVKDIRSKVEDGYSISKLAAKYDVSVTTIRNIAKRINYKEVA